MTHGHTFVTSAKGFLGFQPEAEIQIDVSPWSASSLIESCCFWEKEQDLESNSKSSPSYESLLGILLEKPVSTLVLLPLWYWEPPFLCHCSSTQQVPGLLVFLPLGCVHYALWIFPDLTLGSSILQRSAQVIKAIQTYWTMSILRAGSLIPVPRICAVLWRCSADTVR